jgi:hypothetical protein
LVVGSITQEIFELSNFSKGVDFKVLIPELKGHWLTDDIDEWIRVEGDYAHLIAYARILWPDFLEHDGCIFRGDRFTESNYLGFMAQSKGDKAAVEAVMNHEHILDMFSNSDPQPSREMILYVGRMLKDFWQAKLNRDFPGRKITVSFLEDFSEDLLFYEITFFQER